MKVFDDQTPIYLQMREEIEKAIIKGLLKEEESIPSIRKIAETYRINQKTAMNALSDLANENIIYKKRGIGFFVSPGSQEKLKQVRKREFKERDIVELIRTSQELGYSKQEFLEEISAKYESEGEV